MQASHWRIARMAGAALGGTAIVVLLLLWLMGFFHAKVPAGAPQDVLPKVPPGARVVTVQATEVPVLESVVGTVEAVERIRVGSRLMARVKQVHVQAAQRVKAGDVLVELDDRDLSAALAEAKAALESAQAALELTRTDLARSQELLQKGIVSAERVDRDRTALRRAEAAVGSQSEVVKRAETALGYATIRAPSDGIVIEKHVEAGNLAIPGQDLVSLYDPARLQLVASVREALAFRLEPGGKVDVRLDALDLSCQATIARIVPEARRQSRSFQVEVTGPCPPGVLTGMFGRLIVQTGTRSVIRLPKAAVRSTGQLDTVFVVRSDGAVLRRFVRIGSAGDADIEVLSGLQAGESILADAAVDLR